MGRDGGRANFVLIQIEGMHCHKCEQTIRKALQTHEGVDEVEVDFASGQASVLFQPGMVSTVQLLDTLRAAGYEPSGFTQSQMNSAPQA
jgi:Cu+-exporting ATPase